MVIQKVEGAFPTSISCSKGGFIIAVGYTDDKIRVIDMRVRGNKQCEFELSG